MTWWRRIGNSEQVEQELDAELRFDFEQRVAENARKGMSETEARRAARLEFGGIEQVKDECRDARGFQFLHSFLQDVRYAFRGMRRSPGFTIVALTTLAVGIGANAAIFTLIDAVLLKSLPVRDPRNLVVLGDARGSGVASGQSGSFILYSWDLYKYLQDAKVFDGLCAVNSSDDKYSVFRDGWAAAQSLGVKLVSGNYFAVLGVNAALGRMIAPSDDSRSAPPVGVVSFRYWKDRLNGDPSVIGSTVDLNRVPVTIVGVAPPEFYGETLQPDPPGFWLPLSTMRQLDPVRSQMDEPDHHWLYLIGRLKPSLPVAQGQARLTAVLRSWLFSREGSAISAERRGDILKSYIELTPGGGGIAHMQRNYSQTLLLLLGISATVLLITCANIANLLLARGAARRAGNSVRLALGASPLRLVQQSLTESLTLAVTSGALALLVAWASTNLLLHLVFRGTDYIPIHAAPDVRVLAFTFALSCAAAVAFGLLPAMRMSSGLAHAMKGAAPGVKGSALSDRRFVLGNALIVGQIALALVVLACAGSFARSLANLAGQSFGFDREHLLIANVDSKLPRYEYSRLGPLYQQIYSHLRSLPGVKDASLSTYSPFNNCCWGYSIRVQGYTPRPNENMEARLNRVSPGYFDSLGTKVLLGRAFDEHDTPASRPVAVVNKTFVDRYLREGDPIGRRFITEDEGSIGDLEIVGVVENAKYDSPREEPAPMAFLPLLQMKADAPRSSGEYGSNFVNTIEVRSTGNPSVIAEQMRRALAGIAPDLPVSRVSAVSGDIGLMLNRESAIASLAAFFGLLALVLTCIGLYGLMAYMMQRRTSEIGIRIALGAQRGMVMGAVIREVLVQGVLGILIGIPATFAVTQLVANQLYGVAPADGKNSAGAAFIVIVCLTIAGYIPARRASKVDPAVALRYE